MRGEGGPSTLRPGPMPGVPRDRRHPRGEGNRPCCPGASPRPCKNPPPVRTPRGDPLPTPWNRPPVAQSPALRTGLEISGPGLCRGGRPHRWGTVPPPEGVGVAAMPDRGISALPARAAGARPVGRCPNSRRRHVVVRRSPCRTAGRSARAGLSPVAGIGGRTWGRCYAPRRMSRLVTACLLVTLPTG